MSGVATLIEMVNKLIQHHSCRKQAWGYQYQNKVVCNWKVTWLDQCQGSRTVMPSLLPRRKINTEGPPHQRQLNSVQVQMPKSVTKDSKIQNSIQSNCCNSEELRRMHASLLLHWVCRPPQAPGHAAGHWVLINIETGSESSWSLKKASLNSKKDSLGTGDWRITF